MNVVIGPVLVPLLAGTALLLVPYPRLRTLVSSLAAAITLALAVAMLLRVAAGEVLVAQMGAWPAPYGITLVVDGLAAMMLTLSAIAGLLVVVFAGSSLQGPPHRGQGSLLNRARERFGAQALLQFLFMGVNMSFVTGDVFNLFVAFEVMLVASYGLLLLGGELPQLREGFKYVVVNLLASAIFVAAAGMSYGLFGTLNMADIAAKVAAHGGDPRITALAAMFGLVFAVKAAAFPLGFWLPNSYPVPAAAVSAFFAAVLTKVGVYALIRTFTLMFPQADSVPPVLLALAGLTVLFGALGTLTRGRWRHLLSFANVASIGYLLAGVFAGTGQGLASGLYYLINSVLVMLALFLLAALAEAIAGPRFEVQGHLAHYPWLGVGCFVVMLSLAGIPPTSGFVGKYGIVAGLLERGGPLGVAVSVAGLLGSLVLLYAVTLVWRGFFWGDAHAVHRVRLPVGMTSTTTIAVGLIVLLTVFSGPVFDFTTLLAERMNDNADYLRAVLRPAVPQGEVP